MTDNTAMRELAKIYRYPVKGLSAEALDSAQLMPGECLAFDRVWAIENGPGRFDPAFPKHLPKINFLMLMRNERLAKLDTRFDEASQILTILRDGKQVARGDLSNRIGRQMIEQFIGAYMSGELRGPPRIVHAKNHNFTDTAPKCLSIINMASLRDLERIAGKPIHPLRFRANLYYEGGSPWEEFDWTGKVVSIGPARVKVIERTQRCDATNVDPESGARDMAIPRTLLTALGHQDMGVYATVIQGGEIKPGERFAPPA